ncbi:ATP-binding protein [Pseudomonas sp. NPDC089530]|uniref:ATP-binding protein n=1 Tax=Pseudomonas sp. NPDC089530 TaxID=3390651 RepID=UPI003D016445
MFKHILYYSMLVAATLSVALFFGQFDIRQLLFGGLGLGVPLLASLGWNAWLHRRLARQRQTQQTLEEQLELMQAWVDGLPHPAYVRDRQGRLRHCNDSFRQSFAIRREEIIGKPVLPGLPEDLLEDPEQAREHHADCQRVMAQGLPLQLERRLRIHGRELSLQHWLLPYRDASGQVQGILGGWVDISQHRQLAADLEAARQQAEAASLAKSLFLANTSEALRTPMNAVVGLLELALQDAEGQPAERPAVAMAYRSAREIQALLGATLDIARLESARLALTPEWLDPCRLVESIVREFDSQARQKHLKLLSTCHSSAEPLDVLLDPLHFKQILGQLLDNAIRFTEQGQVRVHLDLQPAAPPQQLLLTLQVTDSGIGIDEQDQQRLFEPFFQAGTGSRRDGAGLGLTLCRHLCELMQGTLQLTSQPGIGTEVRLGLQLACQAARQPKAPVEPPIAHASQPLNVLVIDDHSANRLLLSEQLRSLGHRCRSADNGAQGLEAWREGFFDLLIVDCNLPGLNGYDLARAIREHERLESRAPCQLFGVTASARPEERQQCRQAGLDGCLFKPVSLASLSQKLSGLRPLPWNGAFSLKALHTLSRGKPRFVLRILTELLHCSYRDRQQLTGLCGEQPPQALAELAHKIKGSALMVQARDLEAHCEALEQASLEDADRHCLTLRRTALEQAMLRFERALQWQLEQQGSTATP